MQACAVQALWSIPPVDLIGHPDVGRFALQNTSSTGVAWKSMPLDDRALCGPSQAVTKLGEATAVQTGVLACDSLICDDVSHVSACLHSL